MKLEQTHVFTLIVDNEFGVLTRITALIRRAGWNIHSLAVAETAVPELSRLTIRLECRGNTVQLVPDRLGRLDCVKQIDLFSPSDQVARELALVRLTQNVNTDTLQNLCANCTVQLIEQKENSILFSLVADSDAVSTAIGALRKLGDVDVARTGSIALRKQNEEAGQ